ncbi:MAG: hypothetical protein Q4F28_03200 [Eubacteriales bacterium]|nr:hypothetical protein [Eubacteriales bacterium]
MKMKQTVEKFSKKLTADNQAIIHSFPGFSVLLKNQKNQIFILSQESKSPDIIAVYQYVHGNEPERLSTIEGQLYIDTPVQYKHYYKSNLHTTDEKNDRIIFVIHHTDLRMHEGYC